MRAIYLDTSAAVKLFKEEPESNALEGWLSGQGSALVLTSDLTRTELPRSLYCAQAGPDALREAWAWLAECALIRFAPGVCDRAGTLCPDRRLRSLDALHTSAALSLQPALVALVTYDQRMAEAADQAGLPVAAPA